jgi:hypothetical protein
VSPLSDRCEEKMRAALAALFTLLSAWFAPWCGVVSCRVGSEVVSARVAVVLAPERGGTVVMMWMRARNKGKPLLVR